jgi:hypothetical protein
VKIAVASGNAFLPIDIDDTSFLTIFQFFITSVTALD